MKGSPKFWNDLSQEVREILNAFVAGGTYGVKVRLPHAFVMTFLFRRDFGLSQKLRTILKMTATHSSNLAAFAFTYKTILFLLKFSRRTRECRMFSSGKMPGIPERPFDSLVAGAFGGYFIWGKYSSVNYQIVLYLLSRTIVSGVQLLASRFSDEGLTACGQGARKWLVGRKTNAYPFFASLVWGFIMYLYESNAPLHPSLKKSMDEIYRLRKSDTLE